MRTTGLAHETVLFISDSRGETNIKIDIGTDGTDEGPDLAGRIREGFLEIIIKLSLQSK